MDDANLIIAISAAVTALAAVTAAIVAYAAFKYVGLPSKKIAELQSVVQYFSEGDSKEMVEARRRVLESASSEISISDDDARQVCNFFHCWGLLVQKGLLHIWVFDGSSGNRVLQLYSALQKFICSQRQQTDNEDYAEGFKWLHKQIERRRA